ncbi:MAG: IS21 family transposase [Planctomycetes bacterium]|nr:IS21 family transposase [Planctomycetota bacterium]
MANRIGMATEDSIRTLYERGWSKRKIARELGVDRETVDRYAPKPAKVTAGIIPVADPEAGGDGSKPAKVTAGIRRCRSVCIGHAPTIEAKVEAGLTAQRIYQDLVEEQGYAGSYEAVKRYVRGLRASDPRRYHRIEVAPGAEAQIDLGTGAWIVDEEGRRRRSHVLRVILSYSRKGYSEALLDQKSEGLMRALENAFRHFGGVPATLVPDNLKAAVTRADWWDPDLNPRMEAFARHYGTALVPTRPKSPWHKGKIERGIGYVKGNALQGRRFASLADENAFLARWEDQVADRRIHGTTREQVRLRFEAERPHLSPLPAMLFPCYQEAPRTVHRDSYVEVQRAYYEVPAEYIGRRVWVRWDAAMVRVFNERHEPVAVHARAEPGRFVGGRTVVPVPADLVARAGRMGDPCAAWAQAVVDQRGPIAVRVILGLLSLARQHPGAGIQRACKQALHQGALRLRDVRRLLETPEGQTSFEFLDEHPLIRNLSEYETLIPWGG